MTAVDTNQNHKSSKPIRLSRRMWPVVPIVISVLLCALWPIVLGPRVLLFAVESRKMSLARGTLGLFVGPDAIDSNGYTALTIASWCRPDFVRLLLDKGANPKLGGRFAPLQEVAGLHKCESGSEIVEMLVNAGAKVSTCGSGVSILQTVEIPEVAEALLKHGADPNQECPPYGNLPIFSAVEKPKILALLLDHGAKIVADEHLKVTPLHSAAGLGAKDYETQVPQRLESAEILLAHGADVNAADKDGRTPMDVAYEHGDKEMVALLAKHGGKAKKHTSLESAEAEANTASEYDDLYSVAEGTRKGPPCSLTMRGDNKSIMEEGDNWSIVRGTVGVAQVNCHASGYFHYAVLGMGAPVPKRLNMPLPSGLPGSARIKFDQDWNNGQMHWYYSRERAKNLVTAIHRGDATHFAMKLVNVGGE